MMRPSSISNRTSYGMGSGPPTTSQAALLKLNEKKKEFDAVAALERTSSAYLERISGLADDCDVMALAGEVHGQVSEQWPRMFHILNLFLASRESSEDQPNAASQEGEMLVRIPIEDAMESNDASTSSQ
ncbi:MAG: hypothetical protein NXY57DRAFT_892846 [Lentinula lateritia]|uniref:DASH complex subunit DAD2 n=1 Tax=Lentinula lateritia TaxID=40482 RepID=A0ABQ8VXD9_9AGAR|nr:MAG: hypothetical protein NXY57DRAFT_892846 [Lentinula lateritia]KAJ4500262.1 hypothetical protein C8R41DRAFT_479031 [Lentinula lateritia]